MINYNKNKLINECLIRYYETFAHTLDTADYVPKEFNAKILTYIFKNMKRQFKKIDREDKQFQKQLAAAQKNKTKKVDKMKKKYYKIQSLDKDLIPVKIKTHKDKKGGHPHIIMDDIDNNHVSVGLSTQKKKGKGKKSGINYSLEQSPLNDGKNSFMRRQGTIAPKSKYSNPQNGAMTSKDYEQAKKYADRAKQKYIDKKNKKK